LVACDDAPPLDVHTTPCIKVEDINFYAATVNTTLGTDDVIMAETNYGDIEVSEDIFEYTVLDVYSHLCFEVTNNKIQEFASARLRDLNEPEPQTVEIEVEVPVIEYVDREVEVEVEVPTYTILATMPEIFQQDLPGIIPITESLAWIYFPLEADNDMPAFQDGDFLILTYIFNERTLLSNQVWKASLTHYRSGIALATFTAEEVYQNISDDTLVEYITRRLEYDDWDEDLQQMYDYLYPEVVE
jgi:hypothetical protein